MDITLINSQLVQEIVIEHPKNATEMDEEGSEINEVKRERNRRRNRRRQRQRRRKREQNKTIYDDDKFHSLLDGSLTDETCDSSTSGDSCSVQRQKNAKRKSNTKRKNKPKVNNLTLEEQEQYVAIDCEMVGCGCHSSRSMVARVTIVDWNNNILFDTYVKPTDEVTDYRTHISGITSDHLNGSNAITLDNCRQTVIDTIQDKIVIGHALKNDLHVLGISHPWHQIRDTAKYKEFMQVRFQDGILWPRKLKHLVKEKLNQDIQEYGKPHSAFEDSVAALNLYKLVRSKWERTVTYNINRTKEIHKSQPMSS